MYSEEAPGRSKARSMWISDDVWQEFNILKIRLSLKTQEATLRYLLDAQSGRVARRFAV